MRNLSLLYLWLMPIFLFSQAKEANLLGRWQDTTLVGSTVHTNVYNEIWGYAIEGHEYAIIGTTAGTHFIEVTEPAMSQEVFFIPGADQGGVIIHRDYHDYQGFLYAVSDEGKSSLQIMDLRQLPDTVTIVYDSNELVERSHNIFIDTTNALLYTLISRGGVSSWSALNVFDISTPTAPVFIQKYNSFGGKPISQVHDAFVRDNIGYLNLGPDGFAIVDFSNPSEAVTLSTLTDYKDKGYNHSGWLTDDCSFYYMADENHGFQIKAVAVDDLCEPEVVSAFDADVLSATSIPHNQVVACNYLYVAYYYDGLRVFDIQNPARPELILQYDTYAPPDGRQFRGAWGVYPFLPSGNILLSDMQSGLFVFEGMKDSCSSQTMPTCVSQATCLATSVTAPSELASLQIQPNPVLTDFWLSINLSTRMDKLSVTLTNLNGQALKVWPLLDVPAGERRLFFELQEALPAGVYFLNLQNEQEMTTMKMIIGR